MALFSADTEFVDRLRTVLSDGAVRPPEPRYLEEPRGKWKGRAAAVVTPGNVGDVSKVVALAAEAKVPVVPYGGGTGLVGGQTMPDGPLPIVVSLERMNRVRAVYPEENVVIAEAGVILSDLHEVAETEGRLFPLSIAAKGSARIGGMLATNAGGVNVLRYGNARDLCLGLEAVLPDGAVWNGLTRLRKDNTGYDLRNLLIGSEGTLGVITAAALKLCPQPAAEGTALFVVKSPAAALTLLNLARDQLGDGVSAFELIHGQGLAFLAETLPSTLLPIEPLPEWLALIDIGLAPSLVPSDALESLYEAAFEADLVSDGLVAQNEKQRNDFWEMREQIPEANRLIGSISSHDISLPLGAIADFIPKANAAINSLGRFRINCFGHLGDGNLHYNVFPPGGESRDAYADQSAIVKTTVHDLVHDFGGSVSAEHGIGRLKTGDLDRYGDPAKLAAMRAVKTALDPLGIMNPGAVLPL